jgi:opacity protein-like surface antigen
MGGYHLFDRKPGLTGFNDQRYDGAVIEGVLGANLPLGPVFVGVEGHGAKGFGDIDWEYGVRGRAGFRAGESGMIYGTVGHTWFEARGNRGFTDRKDWVYGLGVEVGPRDIGLGGLTGQSGARIRLSVETFDGKSIRPMGGLIFHF